MKNIVCNYSNKELKKVYSFIEENFGFVAEEFNESIFKTNELNFKIAIVPPTDEQPFYKLVTVGAGAYKMNVQSKLKKQPNARAEYVIYLPKDWDFDTINAKNYWPVELLERTACYASEANTWLGAGHSISGIGTGLFESLVLFPCFDKANENELAALNLGIGKKVSFYQIFPLYKEEAEFYENEGMEALLNKLDEKDLDCVVNINRKNYC